MRQLIETAATMQPHARDRRDRNIQFRLAARAGVRLLARGGTRYADAVIEGLGDPAAPGGMCIECERPWVQEWAVREMGRAMDRAMGHPAVQVQVLQLIQHELGCRDEHEARTLIGMARSVEGLDRAGVLALCREELERDGWRCLPPEANATEGANGHAG